MDNKGLGRVPAEPSSREPSPTVSALTGFDPSREAARVARIVADRCHGDRKPNQAQERYSIIYQAARLGALESIGAGFDSGYLEGEPPTCEACSKPVLRGQFVDCYEDVGEVHADCSSPWDVPDDINGRVVLLGSPLQRFAIATEAQRAETVKQGSVHEGAGLQGIAQPQSLSPKKESDNG